MICVMGLCLKISTVLLRTPIQSPPLNQLLTPILFLTMIPAYCSDMRENVHRLGLVKPPISPEIIVLSCWNTEQLKHGGKSNTNLCRRSLVIGSAVDLVMSL